MTFNSSIRPVSGQATMPDNPRTGSLASSLIPDNELSLVCHQCLNLRSQFLCGHLYQRLESFRVDPKVFAHNLISHARGL